MQSQDWPLSCLIDPRTIGFNNEAPGPQFLGTTVSTPYLMNFLRQEFSFPSKYLELVINLHSVFPENPFYNNAL